METTAASGGLCTVGLRTAGSGLHEQLYEGYSAPEQYSTAEFEGRYTDEYSLAAVFYRMVCGQAPVPAAQRIVADSNPRAKSVNGSLPLYVSQVLQLGLRLRPMERIQTVPQLYQALSSKEYTAELTRTMKPETPVRTAQPEPERKEHLLSLKALLAGIVILLSILILLTLWSVLSQHIHQPAASAAESEPASSEVMVPQNLVPNLLAWTTRRCRTTGNIPACICSTSPRNTAIPPRRARSSSRSRARTLCSRQGRPYGWW